MIGEGSTMEDLCQVYLTELRQQFGRAIAVPDEFRWEWLSIPHLFASPFYCYAYSFGNLLVLALYALYRTHGESFVPRYLALLAAGGSRSPEVLLKDFGVDIRSESFWQSGFETIKEWGRSSKKLRELHRRHLCRGEPMCSPNSGQTHRSAPTSVKALECLSTTTWIVTSRKAGRGLRSGWVARLKFRRSARTPRVATICGGGRRRH